MSQVRYYLINALFLIGVLGFSWLITYWFTGTMYYRCPGCRTLNAKRRTQCRACAHPFPPKS